MRDTPVLARKSENTVANVAATGNALRNHDATDALGRPSQSSRIRPKNSADFKEARRIADELLKLHRDGAIKGAADASFFARLIRDFCATYTAPKRTAAPDPACPYVPTAMQRVRVPSGVSLEERQSFLQKDLDDAIAYEPSAEEIRDRSDDAANRTRSCLRTAQRWLDQIDPRRCSQAHFPCSQRRITSTGSAASRRPGFPAQRRAAGRLQDRKQRTRTTLTHSSGSLPTTKRPALPEPTDWSPCRVREPLPL